MEIAKEDKQLIHLCQVVSSASANLCEVQPPEPAPLSEMIIYSVLHFYDFPLFEV